MGNTYVIGTTKYANLEGIVRPDSGSNRAFLTKFKPDGQIAYMTILGPTPRYDEGGFADSDGWQVVVDPFDLPVVSFMTFETNTYKLLAGGLLPLPGSPEVLHIKKLDAAGQPMWDVIAPVLDTPGHFAPTLFYGVHMTTDNVGDVYVTYTACSPTSTTTVTSMLLAPAWDRASASCSDAATAAFQPVTLRVLQAFWPISIRMADSTWRRSVTVRDDDGAAASDTLIVTVSNVSPLVDSGSDRIVDLRNFVALPVSDFFDLFNEDVGTHSLLRLAGSFVDPGAFDTHTATIDWGDDTTESVPVTERSFGPNGLRPVSAVLFRHSTGMPVSAPIR